MAKASDNSFIIVDGVKMTIKAYKESVAARQKERRGKKRWLKVEKPKKAEKTVKEIGIRTTSIMDTGRNIKIVNNSDMKNILNRSDNASIAAASIDIPYPTDLEKLEQQIPALMQDIYSRHQDVMLSAPRYLGVQELGASGITLKFIVEIEEGNIFSVPRILNHDLLLGFRKLGVECPFPQLDVHNG